jgi:hypothetical protein
MRELVEDCAHTHQRLPVTRRQKHADTGDQYSATMNVRDLPSRIRTCLICTAAPHEYDRKCDCNLCGDTHPLQKKLAVHVLDGIETEAGAACGLTHCPSTDRSVV